MLNLILRTGDPLFTAEFPLGVNPTMEGLTVSAVLTRKLTSSAFKET